MSVESKKVVGPVEHRCQWDQKILGLWFRREGLEGQKAGGQPSGMPRIENLEVVPLLIMPLGFSG